MESRWSTNPLQPGGPSTPSSTNASDELIRFLGRPDSYGEGTRRVELKETHISWVALTDCRVFKVKKPVEFSFLDYGTLEGRQHACEEELRLGTRLAPGVYLECLPIARGAAGHLEFGGRGEIVDYCVVMKRLPQERMLDRLIERDAATKRDIERLLDVLVPFYAQAARGPELDRFGTADAIERQVRDNLTTLAATEHGFPQPMLAQVRSSQLQFLGISADLFADRIRAGRVCEGHGDLRAEHVCLTSPPVVFDCVEFSVALRAGDVATELAFLAMDCDRLGARALGAALIHGYRARSGDDLPDELLAFYKSHRACVRAKVESLRAAQQPEPAAAQFRARARQYLQLASSYAGLFYRPTLFVMVGASGTGKSTVAEALAQALGLEMLRTDAIRHELAGRREPEASRGEGIYSDSFSASTYAALFLAASLRLGEGVSIVLDGTFRDPRQCERAVELARRRGAALRFIVCECPPEVARQRIAARTARNDDVSDARPELVDLQLEQLRAGAGWKRHPVVVLDTRQPVEASVARVIRSFRETHRLEPSQAGR